jgi:hypothetical protein
MVSLEPNGEGRPAYFQSTYQGAASTTPICQLIKPACYSQANLELSGDGQAESRARLKTRTPLPALPRDLRCDTRSVADPYPGCNPPAIRVSLKICES